MQFAKRTEWELATNSIMQVVQKLKEEGVSLLDLTISNPTQCGFDVPTAKIEESFLCADNFFYSPDSRGLLSAREVVCAYYQDKGIAVRPEQVFLTSSTSEAYSFLF